MSTSAAAAATRDAGTTTTGTNEGNKHGNDNNEHEKEPSPSSSPQPPPPIRNIKREMNETMLFKEDAVQSQHAEDNGQESSLNQDNNNVLPTTTAAAATTADIDIAQSDYKAANKLPFAMLCKCLETLWDKKRARSMGQQKQQRPPRQLRKWSQDEKLRYLLPPQLLVRLKGGDPYPLLRLIMPQIDSKRPNTGMQERAIGESYMAALGLKHTSRDGEKLQYYTRPTAATTTANDGGGGSDFIAAAGDLSEIVRRVVAERYANRPSRTTVGQVNEWLDELAALKRTSSASGRSGGRPRSAHEWRSSQSQHNESSSNNNNNSSQTTTTTTATSGDKKERQALSLKDRRANWVRRLLRIPLCPLEHKWIVRILLQKMDIGLTHKTILAYLSPYADDLYNANNSLKRVCATLSNVEWVKRRQEREREEELERQQDTWQHYMPRSSVVASLGNTISPMLANRTTFEAAMTDIENRHCKFAKELKDDDPLAKSLALKFPTFICETKLDGERMLLHVNRGVVTVQTRNSKWYSNLYSPTLGPPIRRAIQKYDVDVILDGEVISWDNGREEIIPFGANRTVARARHKWCAKEGLLEERDLNHHQDESDLNVVSIGNWDKKTSSSGGGRSDVEPGAECWLQYIVFDILYVGGPDAARLISEATSLAEDDVPTGSILNLSGFDRKKILYRLIEPQANQVEFVPSLVVRRDGRSQNAAIYFSPTTPSMESGLPCSTVDSVEQIVTNNVPNYEEMDAKARSSKTDDEISSLRARAMHKFYVDIVETQGKEGLVFKDLLAPYCIGDQSRSLRYWNKIKPDYDSQGHSASDIDTAILGAYYATGMAKSGQLNAFLVGCVDEKNPGQFMTLCKVNGGSVGWQKLKKIFEYTGFRKDENGTVSYGKWFQECNHGKAVPDFISRRSFQDGNESSKGWTLQAKHYPDLWIDPEDSVVLTLNSGEITTSDGFSAGVTLRFPRIEKVRLESVDGDAKLAIEVETCGKLHQLYREMEDRRKESSLGFEWGSPARSATVAGPSRFLTTNENTKRKKSRPRKKAEQVSQMPKVEKKDSAALSGVTLVVLEGNYALDEDSLDAMEAKEEGWFDDAKKVKSRMDVLEFIAKHSGTSKVAISSDTDVILGGSVDDARVAMYSRMLDSGSDPGKKDTALVRLRQLGGIVKWTYVYSSVRRWIDEASQVKMEEEPKGNQLSIRGAPTIANTQLPRPSRHDYLFIGKSAQLDDEDEVFGIRAWKDINIFDLKRGLEEVQRSKRRDKNDERNDHPKRMKLQTQSTDIQAVSGGVVPWQCAAIASLPSCDRWILAGDLENLWTFRKDSTNATDGDPRPTVVYPDLFNDCGMHDNQDVLDEVASIAPSTRWAELTPDSQVGSLSSTLPLARTMGAQVTPHLHDGVTHVLSLLRNQDRVAWNPHDFRPELFEDPIRAMKLHRRLLAIHEKTRHLLSRL